MRLHLLAMTILATAPLPALAQTPPPAPATAPADGPEDAKLKALFAASDEASLRRNPIQALFRGDLRYADRLGDYLSDAYFAGEKAAADPARC